MLSNNQQAFLALVRAGLWEEDVCLLPYGEIDFNDIYKLAQEQSVVGLVSAGLEHVVDIKLPKEAVLAFVGDSLLLEKRNISMNAFIASLIEKMRRAGIYALLVKGQGVAQCYKRPLWRASGDVDLFLSDNNYDKAFKYLTSVASIIEKEDSFKKHIALTIDSWEVELHGSLRCGLWKKLDKALDEISDEIFFRGAVRSWMNGNIQIFLPRADEDVVFVFAHILQHFFKGGIGLRQICDWCRLLWSYKNKIDCHLLETRLKKAGMLSEWKAFASFVVTYLGMPEDCIPFYKKRKYNNKKKQRILLSIFETGNFGHDRDISYFKTKPYFKRKFISFWRHTKDNIRLFFIFPIDSAILWSRMVATGIIAVFRGQ